MSVPQQSALTNDGAGPQKPTKARMSLVLVLVALVLLEAATLMPAIWGVGVLPSPDWVARSGPFAIALGIAHGALTARWLWYSPLNGKPFWRWLGLPMVALVAYIMGHALIAATPPMLAATFAGRPVAFAYEVRNPKTSSKYCKRGIALRHMPLMFATICDPDEALLGRMQRGSRIVVGGKGTSLGLFPERIAFLAGRAAFPTKKAAPLGGPVLR